MTDKPLFTDDDIIYSYTRADAIADGTLIDITQLAKEAGFTSPVAVTAAAWVAAIEPPSDAPDQSIEGRTWDILNVLIFAARNERNSSRIDFTVRVKQQSGVSRDVALKALVHPGDAGERVITVMLTHED
jgi:hypothetical protein